MNKYLRQFVRIGVKISLDPKHYFKGEVMQKPLRFRLRFGQDRKRFLSFSFVL